MKYRIIMYYKTVINEPYKTATHEFSSYVDACNKWCECERLLEERLHDGTYIHAQLECNFVLAEHLKLCKEEQGWIPVSERLPEDQEVVLVSTKTDRVFEGRYYDDNTNRQWYSFRNDTFAWNNVVTAWMPLPESYRAESEVQDDNIGN